MSERGHVMQPSFAPQPALTRGSTGRYSLVLTGFLLTLAVTLLTVVDMRRAFFLAPSAYSKLGAPSAFLNYTPWHVVVLIVAVSAAWGCYRLLRREDAILGATSELRRMRNIMATVVMLFLIIDLFIYRGVQAGRIAGAGQLGVSLTFWVPGLPAWLRPLGEATNFLLVVWHATVLGVLIGALLLVLICSSQALRRLLGSTGLRAHVAGALLAVPYPFCSCCAGPVGAALYRGGASLGTTLAFVVAAPMLNLTTLSLALVLLPTPFALLRVLGGLAAAVIGTYLVWWALGARRLPRSGPPVAAGRWAPWLDRLTRLFALERHIQSREADTPATLVAVWFSVAWRLGRVAVPVLYVGAIVVSVVAPPILSFGGRNDALTVIIAAALGTLLMIPTWTELALVPPLIQQGLTGPAAALLLTLPAVSVPGLVILAGALGSYRVPAFLGGVVFAGGVLAGLIFL